ncbi:MAG TPA: SDR family NAD(P)-dependent oxidoreductase, partial [Nitrospira sp.]
MGAKSDSDHHMPTGAGAESVLWGFGRVAQTEYPDFEIRLIDLHPQMDVATASKALACELALHDAESEVVLSKNGERYAVRLRETRRPVTDHKLVSDGIVRLGFEVPGRLSALRWERSPGRLLGEDEVDVEVRATGLNFRDVMYAQGLLPESALGNGFAGATLGLEFSGVVRRIGSHVRHLSVGDAVLGFGPACFADRVVTAARAVTRLPVGLSFEAGATIPTAFFTAYYSVQHLARLQQGESILIHGAAGGVGMAAIQIAQWIGADIHATAGSDVKRDILRLMGVQHVYDSRSLAYAREVLDRTEGQGVDVVLNSLAGEAIRRNLEVLKPFGRFLELGKRDFYEDTRIGLRPFRNNISYYGIDVDQLMQANPALTQRLFAELLDLFTAGVLHPLPCRVFEGTEIVDAFRYMQQSRHIGKVVVAYRDGFPEALPMGPIERKRLTLVSDASYVVSGGLSGFGLATARWLVEHGARHLVLISRTGPQSQEAKEAVDQLTQRGVEVLATACDVADGKAVDRLCTEIRSSMPPLRGIIHAAGVIEDARISHLGEEQLRRVLAPKVLGGLHLHRATQRDRLDFFVLYSSATTLFGNAGQAAYVAANQYLGALARARRAIGLTACC